MMPHLPGQSLGSLRIFVGVLLGLLGGVTISAEPRTWTSSAGTTVLADYVAKVGDQHWLRKEGAGLLKLGSSDLSLADVEFIQAQLSGTTERPHASGRIVVLEKPTARDAEMLETLLGTTLPTLTFKSTPLRAALDQLSAAIAEFAPGRGTIEFRVHPECGEPLISMTFRNLSGWRALQIITANVGASVVFRGDHVEIVPSALVRAQAQAVSASPVLPPVVAVLSSTPAVCSVASAVRQYLEQGGFERDSKKWVMPNREKQFKRVAATEVGTYRDAPKLGAKVMRIDPAPEAMRDGPPYITQTVRFSTKPAKVRLCVSVLHVGALEREASIRLSAYDPEARYTDVTNNTFPFTYGHVGESGRWIHLEGELDLSTIQNREIVFGFMFPSGSGEWYFDNLQVTVE